MSKKLPIAKKVLKERGFLGFIIVCLEYIDKHTARGPRRDTYKHKIYTKANWDEIVKADISEPPVRWPGTNKKKLHVNWLMPPPGKGSGGHMTLFRFIGALEKAGHVCTIYCYVPGSKYGSISAVKAIMGESFPALKATMYWLHDDEEMKPADAVFATSWETAYPIYNSKLKAKRFYFVQDFEPYFYPVGSFSVLAENTYRFGFYGITAGGWLAKKLSHDYGMRTDFITFGSDSAIYQYKNAERRTEVLFYARPNTERRGFELGLIALDIFHRQHPEYTINFVGADVSSMSIPFPYRNLKILEHVELCEVYNRCGAALVMSLTNMSLLPLELLACGTIPVVNDGENNRLVSDNPYITYANSNPHDLARALSNVVNRKDLSTYSMAAAKAAAMESWEESGAKFVKIVERETHERG